MSALEARQKFDNLFFLPSHSDPFIQEQYKKESGV